MHRKYFPTNKIGLDVFQQDLDHIKYHLTSFLYLLLKSKELRNVSRTESEVVVTHLQKILFAFRISVSI